MAKLVSDSNSIVPVDEKDKDMTVQPGLSSRLMSGTSCCFICCISGASFVAASCRDFLQRFRHQNSFQNDRLRPKTGSTTPQKGRRSTGLSNSKETMIT